MKTILLIEDNDDIRDNISEIVELAQYKVLTASDGKEGVAIAIKERPDLIVCDIMMPVLDGYGVLHMLHKNAELQNIPFIFLSAKAERAEIRKGMELGADDYITKPFSGTELLNAIESRLRKADLIQQHFTTDLNGLNTLIQTVSGADVLKNFLQNRDTNNFKKKQTIYAEDHQPYRLYYIQRGRVKTYKTSENGKELITGVYSDGDFLGHVALLEGTNYRETAEGLEDCEVTSIPRSEFEELINNNREVMKKFIQLLAKNISQKEEQLLGLAYNSLRKRVADVLVRISEKYNPTSRSGIDISRENLANIAGTAKESFIRTLSDFKDEGLVDIDKGNIIILNKQKLEKMMN